MTRRIRNGFTLLEVLVALSIVALALTAGMQATRALSRNAQRQSDVLLAQICAENEFVALRLARRMPAVGEHTVDCTQADQTFMLAVSAQPTPNPNFLRVTALVKRDQTPVLSLSTLVGRY